MLIRTAVAGLAATAALASAVRAVDIVGVEPAALDQPRINAAVSLTAGGVPLSADLGGLESFNIEAYYDTGASGILISNNTADLLGLTRATFNGQDVIYSDVGVAGTSDFNVSTPIHISLAPFHPSADIDDVSTYASVYNQRFGPVRAQVGPVGIEPDPAVGDLDVFGMPTMAGKVIVMDPKPVDTFLDTMRTYVYDPGTPFDSTRRDTNPGIPVTDRTVKLSYVNFDRFTKTSPAGAAPPSLRNNPFIGPNPFVAGDSTPGVRISYGGNSTEGSFLLDTGAAASIISSGTASELGVTYDPDADADDPILMFNGHPVPDQFQLTIGGIGGSKRVAGFYLSSLLLRTEEGVASNLTDPNHMNFLDAPVLVSDISVANPDVPGDVYTLDGIFGMNFLVASAAIAGADASGIPLIGNLSGGKFDWITFDEPNGKMGLKLAPPSPQDQVQWVGDITGQRQNYWDQDTDNWRITGVGLVTYAEGDRVYFGTTTLDDTIRLNETVTPGGVTFDNDYDYESDGGTNYELIGTGKITGFGGLIKRGTGLVTIRTSNDYTGATVVEAGTVMFYGSQDIGPLSIQAAGGAHIANSARHRFESIDVAGTLLVSAAPIIKTTTLSVGPTGQFDMADAKLVIDASAIAPTPENPVTPTTTQDVRTMLAAGYAGGTWTGNGLVSRLAAADGRLGIGYVRAGDVFATVPASWNGETIDASSILIALTLRGDANLDGRVVFDDLLSLAQNYGLLGKVWSQGDFTYDGRVGFEDLLGLAQNYGGTRLDAAGFEGASPQFVADWALAQSLVPEPATAALLAALPFVSRRRRR